MEAKLKKALGLSSLKARGETHSGCISQGNVYDTDTGPIFVKINDGEKARVMFEGELEGLKAIKETQTIRVPTPMKIVDFNSSKISLVMEYITMSGLSNYADKLGEQLAKMHLFNERLKSSDSSIHKGNESSLPVKINKFGFHTTTCCGSIPQENVWKDDWVEFYAQQKLLYQINLAEENHGDREATELWSQLSLKLSDFFKGVEIKPALLHGDLWSGNVAQTDEGPVIFDPAVFYGHSEYELSIADMFGGFPKSFYNAYHELIPKEHNFDKRKDLYKLFHCLNHWNLFGGGYRSSSISIMKRLLKDT